jgi:hypothetical protein
MDTLMDLTGVHRYRNGRMDVDFSSRGLQPRWKLVKVDGVWYDRKDMARWILDRGPVSPVTRRPLTPETVTNATNVAPFRIIGKARVTSTNDAAGRTGQTSA